MPAAIPPQAGASPPPPLPSLAGQPSTVLPSIPPAGIQSQTLASPPPSNSPSSAPYLASAPVSSPHPASSPLNAQGIPLQNLNLTNQVIALPQQLPAATPFQEAVNPAKQSPVIAPAQAAQEGGSFQSFNLSQLSSGSTPPQQAPTGAPVPDNAAAFQSLNLSALSAAPSGGSFNPAGTSSSPLLPTLVDYFQSACRLKASSGFCLVSIKRLTICRHSGKQMLGDEVHRAKLRCTNKHANPSSITAPLQGMMVFDPMLQIY